MITHSEQEEYIFFNKSDGKDLLQTPDKALFPVIRRRKRRRYWGRRSGCLVRIWRRAGNLRLPSVLLANVQSMENKIGKLRSRISYQWDVKNCNILFSPSRGWTTSWITFSWWVLRFFGRIEQRPLVTRGGGLCIFVNNSWCTESKEVLRFCPPEVEYLMIICRPHYLPIEFSSIFFVAYHHKPMLALRPHSMSFIRP